MNIHPYIYAGIEHGTKLNFIEEHRLHNIDLDTILEVVSNHLCLSGYEVRYINKFVRKQKSQYSYARHLICYFAKKRRYTLYNIRDYFKFKDHTSVTHGINNINNLLDTEQQTRDDVEVIGRKIENCLELKKINELIKN